MSRFRFGIDDNPVDVLKHYWGYDSFRSIQLDIITSVLNGHDTLGLMPTGGGKSITFQVPAMMLPGLTIVVTPLISLMKDQVDNLLSHGIRAHCIFGGMSRRETNLVYDKCRLGKTKILYISPERLQVASFLEILQQWEISLIVVDEAHCISQWGYDFRPSYLHICDLRKVLDNVPVLALTASATPRVRADIAEKLHFKDGFNEFSISFARDNINYIVRRTPDKEGKLIEVLANTSGPAIVYVRSRQRTKVLAQLIGSNRISAQFYHAGLDAEDKSKRQDEWKSGKTRVIVATNAFGMGIDKSDVRVVIHYDLPPSIEEYYQEAGRAGRDGKQSFAVVIAAPHDKATLKKNITESFPSKDFIRRVYELVGNFLDVGVGEGYDHVYEFDIDSFCATYKLEQRRVRSALEILTRSLYLEFIDRLHSKSRVIITAHRDELYSLDIPPEADKVLQALLRRYTGLFSDYVYFSESALSLDTGINIDTVYQSMLMLSRMKIIHYVPRSAVPHIYYPTSRELPKYIDFPPAVYELRKQLLERRVDAVLHLVFNDMHCRQKTILNYFGEADAKPCGKCDVCRTNSKKRISGDNKTNQEIPSEQYVQRFVLLNASHPGGTTISKLTHHNLAAPRHIVIEMVRLLAEEKLIIVSTDGQITLNPDKPTKII